MTEVERIKERYERRASRPKNLYSHFSHGNLFIVQQRERAVLTALRRNGVASLEDKLILDVGCGPGGWLRDFLRWGARPERLFGVELLEERTRQAKRLNPNFHLIQANGEVLPFPDDQFHIVLQSTVFTSILDNEMRRRVAQEMLRVLCDQGIILWYDFRYNNPVNADVRGVGRREIFALFPRCHIELWTVTLVPPLARAIAPFSWLLCQLLEQLPILRTHYLGVIRKG